MKKITVQTIINAPLEKVWELWTLPKHITQWCHASDDWEAPYADNDLKVDGKFTTRMAAKDGSVSFDFEGTYTKVVIYKYIAYAIADGRQVDIEFDHTNDGIKITETFDAESVNSEEKQRSGWQSILDNFKKYVETTK